ncbi:unnamed protein product [Closterium sp. Yama58-4]|nr:unnamed protein product [Closterium sp. Yama58-4]
MICVAAILRANRKVLLLVQVLPHEVLPHEVLPHEVLPHEVLPHEVLPHEVLPHEVLPHEVLPHEVLPHEVLPHEVLPHEVLPHEVLPHEVLPHEVLPHEVLPHEVLPHEVLPHEALPSRGASLTRRFLTRRPSMCFPPLASLPPPSIIHQAPEFAGNKRQLQSLKDRLEQMVQPRLSDALTHSKVGLDSCTPCLKHLEEHLRFPFKRRYGDYERAQLAADLAGIDLRPGGAVKQVGQRGLVLADAVRRMEVRGGAVRCMEVLLFASSHHLSSPFRFHSPTAQAAIPAAMAALEAAVERSRLHRELNSVAHRSPPLSAPLPPLHRRPSQQPWQHWKQQWSAVSPSQGAQRQQRSSPLSTTPSSSSSPASPPASNPSPRSAASPLPLLPTLPPPPLPPLQPEPPAQARTEPIHAPALIRLLDELRDPRIHALPRTAQRVRSFQEAVSSLVYDVLIAKVRSSLTPSLNPRSLARIALITRLVAQLVNLFPQLLLCSSPHRPLSRPYAHCHCLFSFHQFISPASSLSPLAPILLHPSPTLQVRRQLAGVSAMPDWALGEEENVFDLPSFNAYALPYITAVGEYLLTLPQQLEPLAVAASEAAPSLLLQASAIGASAGGESATPTAAGEEDAGAYFVREWMTKVADGATSLFVEQIRAIPEVSDRGAQQLAADIEYLCSVLSVLYVAASPAIATFQACFATPKASLAEFIAQESGVGRLQL